MSETKEITLTTKVNKLFASRTPKEHVKTRPGAGGMVLKYVEIGYVVSQLNKTFGPFWEWRLNDKQIGTDQLWVQGELTVKTQNGFSVTKSGFGGATIKKSKKDGKAISIGNDLKAASSDALKKAASLFGIGADVYYKEMDQYDSSADELDVKKEEDESIKKIVINKFFAITAERGFEPEEAKERIKEIFRVQHLEELSVEQLDSSIKNIEKNYQIVKKGEKPLKVGAVRELIEAEDDTDKELLCRQCGKSVDLTDKEREKGVSDHFCNLECQNEYWKIDTDRERRRKTFQFTK